MSTTEPVHIGQIIRNAHVFNVKHWQGGGTMPTDDLLQTVAQLFRLLEQRRTSYVLVGGIALLQYIQGRNTEDVDLIMALSDLKKLPEIQISSEDSYFARGTFQGLQINILLTRNPLFAQVERAHTTRQRFFEQEVACATVDGLVLLKLYALPSLYPQGNFARAGLYENDLATLIYYHQPDLTVLLDELAQHVSDSDLAAIHDVLNDIQQRIRRFQQSTNG